MVLVTSTDWNGLCDLGSLDQQSHCIEDFSSRALPLPGLPVALLFSLSVQRARHSMDCFSPRTLKLSFPLQHVFGGNGFGISCAAQYGRCIPIKCVQNFFGLFSKPITQQMSALYIGVMSLLFHPHTLFSLTDSDIHTEYPRREFMV